MKIKTGLSVVSIVLVAIIAGYFGYIHLVGQRVFGAQTYPISTGTDFVDWETDVIGTHKGSTSTTFVPFSNATNNVTSSYITRIGRDKILAIYRLRAGNTSSTASAMFQVLGSNDFGCDSNTTTLANSILMSDISWTSAMDHLKGKVHATSFVSTASSTVIIPWANPTSTVSEEIILDELNYECLKLQVSGVSTSLWAGITTKQ